MMNIRNLAAGLALALGGLCAGAASATTVNFQGGHDWLRAHGVNVIDLQDPDCVAMLGDWIAAHPDVWHEDIGED